MENNMTPEQKALHLLEKMAYICDSEECKYPIAAAKQCALICVDEILDSMLSFQNEAIWHEPIEFKITQAEEYWQQVKEHLLAIK